MKGFIAGVIFTLVAESAVAAALLVNTIMKGAEEE